MGQQDLHVQLRLEDGGMWATVDEYPGVFASGETLDELRDSLAEGIALYVAPAGEPPPQVMVELAVTAQASAKASAELVPA